MKKIKFHLLLLLSVFVGSASFAAEKKTRFPANDSSGLLVDFLGSCSLKDQPDVKLAPTIKSFHMFFPPYVASDKPQSGSGYFFLVFGDQGVESTLFPSKFKTSINNGQGEINMVTDVDMSSIGIAKVEYKVRLNFQTHLYELQIAQNGSASFKSSFDCKK